jgi:hypothetical protein
MSAIAISNWLRSEQNYGEGLALLEQSGSGNGPLLRLLKTGDSPYTRAKLLEEIQLLAVFARPETSGLRGISVYPANPAVSTPSEKVLPEQITQLIEQRSKLYKESARLHSQLTLLASNEERFRHALAIRKNFRLVNQYWAQIKQFEQTGQLPQPAAECRPADPSQLPLVPAEPVVMMERLRNVRTYISKHKGNPKRADDVAGWIVERDELERRLKDA